MLDGYTSDKEQVESIRKWWDESGKGIVLAIVLGLAIGFGWKYWHQLQIRRAENASVVYQSVLQADMQNHLSKAQGGATILMTRFSGTPYASLAGLLFAKEAVAQNNLPLALSKLEWVISHSHSPQLKQIAQLSAARILLSQGNTTAALAQLKTLSSKQFQPAEDWIKGDIYSKEGDVKKAKAHYQSAQSALQGFSEADAALTAQLANLP